MKKNQYLVVGSGIAGLVMALKLAKSGKVTLLTKRNLASGSTGLAQGGIAGVRQNSEDTFEEHYQDTLKAGCYLNDPIAVRYLVENAPVALKTLEEYGVHFDFSLHREGGHSRARIAHVADETGRAVHEILIDRVREHANIQIMENCFVVDLIKKDNDIVGVYYANITQNSNVSSGSSDIKKSKIKSSRESMDVAQCSKSISLSKIFADAVILAAGGAGQVYAKTTNPAVVTGDGIAMAIRAGATVQDLEFVQFHPTAFDYPCDPMFLLTEALRGDGAILLNQKGERFIDELAPRDIVARAIFQQEKVFLDFRHQKKAELIKKFPHIYENLLNLGFDLSQDLIQVTPAVHFICGGVKTDITGKTDLSNLYALGETACTGVHGANRLASNSLLEAVVFAQAIAEDLEKRPGDFIDDVNGNLVVNNNEHKSIIEDNESFIPESEQSLQARQKIQQLMWQYAGLIRSRHGLNYLQVELGKLNPKGTETMNLLNVAKAITEAALCRQKSVGGHYLEE